MSFSPSMKHAHAPDVWSAVQDKAKQLCIEEGAIDWQKRIFCDVAFDAFPLDFRSKEGKAFRSKCQHIGNTAKLKRFTLTLAKVVQSATPDTKLPPGGVVLPSPTELAYLSTIPQASLLRLGHLILRWWYKHCCVQKGRTIHIPTVWKNDVEPVTQEALDSIPPPFLFTHIDSQQCAYAFDVRTLHVLFKNQMLTNPFTNEPFASSVVETVKRRVLRLDRMGYSIALENNQPKAKLSTQQENKNRILNIVQALDRMGYHITVEMLENLAPQQQVKWYLRCEDIWNYRAELSASVKARIAPDGNVFRMKASIKSYGNRKVQLFKHTLDAMHKLVATGITEADRVTGSMYVLGALTECSTVFRDAFPMLHQPP